MVWVGLQVGCSGSVGGCRCILIFALGAAFVGVKQQKNCRNTICSSTNIPAFLGPAVTQSAGEGRIGSFQFHSSLHQLTCTSRPLDRSDGLAAAVAFFVPYAETGLCFRLDLPAGGGMSRCQLPFGLVLVLLASTANATADRLLLAQAQTGASTNPSYANIWDAVNK